MAQIQRSVGSLPDDMKRSSNSIHVLAAVLAMVASTGLVVSAQQVDPAIYQRVVDENIELRQEQTRLAKENSDLRRKNADLILDLQDLESKRDQLAVLVSQLKTPDESNAELDRLRAERTALLTELERIRKAVPVVVPPAVTHSSPPPPAPKEGSSLFQKIEQENADLRQQLVRERETVQLSLKTNEELKARVSGLMAKTDTLTQSLEMARRDSAQAGAKEAALKKAVEKLARQSFQQQEEIARLRSAATGAAPKPLQAPSSEVAPPTLQAVSPGEPVTADDDGGGLLAAAQRALKARRVSEAKSLYEEALEKNPKDPRVYYNLGVLNSDYLKEPGKAARYFRKYLELAPRAGDAAQVRAWILDLESKTKW